MSKLLARLRTKGLAGWIAIILLSAGAVSVAVYVAIKLPSEQYSPIVSLAGSMASFLAVIWFTATLIYQSRQLSEQRQQFALSFDQARRDAQREALVVADGILKEAEKAALSLNPTLNAIGEVVSAYMDFKAMAVMLKSTDAIEVLEAGKEWLKREGPALTLVKAIQTAFKVYVDSTGDASFNFSQDPEEFVYINGPYIWKLPYFQRYEGIVQMLTEFMIKIEPGRKAALLAYTIAVGLSTSKSILNREKILKDIKNLEERNHFVPEIAKGF